ncbi:hypothetical protein M5689_020382 [Euphorbia peplus]|nr:hypothetical protein M5689_020382 [Euphorbia peplus]
MGGEEEKKKLNSEENPVPVPNFDDQRDVYRFSYVQQPLHSDFECNFYFSAYQNFAKEHNDSMGFNVQHFFPKRLDNLLSMKSVPLYPPLMVFEACEMAVKTVLDNLDKMNELSLSLVRIVTANYRSDSLFFVTFEAKTKVEGLIEEYQSVIFRHLDHDHIVLHMFTKVGDVKGAVQYDRREMYKFDKIGGVNRSDFKSHDDYIAYRKYAKEHDVSEGFDIKHFPLQPDCKKALLKHLCTRDKTLFQDCKVAVECVLEYLETKDEDRLELVRVIKANYTFNYLFFVTFEARHKGSAKLDEYQSVIFCHRGKLDLRLFRKKGDVKGVVKHDARDNYNFIPIGEGRESDFKRKADFNEYRLYAKDHNDSEGFDIEHPILRLSCGVMGALHPVEDTSMLEYCETAVKNVLKYLERKKERTLEFKKVIKANYTPAYLFYVTFVAKVTTKVKKGKEKGEEKENEYQAVLYWQYTNGEICLHMFRKKGEKLKPKVAKPVVDVRDEYEFARATQLPSSKFEDLSEYCNHVQYVKEHDSSEGFDIETFFSGNAFRRLYKADTDRLEHCKVAAERALDYLRSQYEENLELVEITKANYRLRNVYFVTLKAKNKDSGEINEYQSVIKYTNTDWVYLEKFRKKESRVQSG